MGSILMNWILTLSFFPLAASRLQRAAVSTELEQDLQPPACHPVNRILYIATTLDPTDWEGFLPAKAGQMAALAQSGIEVYMLGFSNAEGLLGTFESSPKASGLKKVSNVAAFDTQKVAAWVDENFVPEKTHLVVGSHGSGSGFAENALTRDSGETILPEDPENDVFVLLESAEFVGLLKGKKFNSIVLDSCVMAELSTAAAFEDATDLLVASEGWMWEDDKDTEKTVFSSYTAKQLACAPLEKTREALDNVVTHYSKFSPRGDLSVIDTSKAAKLASQIRQSGKLMEKLHEWFEGVEEEPIKFAPGTFYKVEGDDAIYDSKYLLSLHKTLGLGESLGYPGLLQMAGETVLFQKGPTAERTETGYTEAIQGISLSLLAFGS
uniref:Uncharacterized protein n=1 Tax=Chromera velia CCMP2878 TaxID=1169474 RepID=A0A0G4GLQ8_9ALVE|eukprot:Cvel_4877.t1-p1 / transcript=Cvel_4877.t1 / gene=Cvel_4877 / organism=Chromera_velia_CCMP2878 / gene_product=hypothetical protein / transcript_product=hypothetical protein / location=Cvel_scaffold220:30389-33186(-) / protein_length=380 / sequence_SO=supercontig / SO=protein_coding / is_pseudo=false